MPAFEISSWRIRARLVFSLKTTRPESGFTLPVTTSSSVVLPAPFGPMTQRSSPLSMLKLSAFSALKPSKTTNTSSM